MTQDLLERRLQDVAPAANRSSVKTILLHVQNDESLGFRTETALALARACDAHLTCLHVTPAEAYVAFDGFGGVFVMNDVIKTIDEEVKRLGRNTEAELANEDVSWDYVEVTGNVAGQIVRHAALADLIVTGRQLRTDFGGPPLALMGELLKRSRTPLFVAVEHGPPPDATGAALIAWDGSYEAANAVRASLGLLQLASEVRLLQVREEKDERFPGTKVLEYLSRHNIHGELTVEHPSNRAGSQNYITGSLIAHAQGMKAAYLVMGGYNHSRLGEYVFGGVTRNLLAESPVPLLIAH